TISRVASGTVTRRSAQRRFRRPASKVLRQRREQLLDRSVTALLDCCTIECDYGRADGAGAANARSSDDYGLARCVGGSIELRRAAFRLKHPAARNVFGDEPSPGEKARKRRIG